MADSMVIVLDVVASYFPRPKIMSRNALMRTTVVTLSRFASRTVESLLRGCSRFPTCFYRFVWCTSLG